MVPTQAESPAYILQAFGSKNGSRNSDGCVSCVGVVNIQTAVFHPSFFRLDI